MVNGSIRNLYVASFNSGYWKGYSFLFNKNLFLSCHPNQGRRNFKIFDGDNWPLSQIWIGLRGLPKYDKDQVLTSSYVPVALQTEIYVEIWHQNISSRSLLHWRLEIKFWPKNSSNGCMRKDRSKLWLITPHHRQCNYDFSKICLMFLHD